VTEYKTPITDRCKAWRNILPAHSACELIPAYSEVELIALGRNIKAAGGMKLPIIILVQPDGTHSLLDGRSRLDAMVAVGIKFEVNVIDGHVVIDAPGHDVPTPTEIPATADFNAIAFVLSTNLHRRHLKNADKRAIAKKVLVAQPALSDRAVAQMVGFDHKTVRAIRQEAYGEIPHKGGRVEATGRKARGRKPDQSPKAPKPVDTLDFVLETVLGPAVSAADKTGSGELPIEEHRARMSALAVEPKPTSTKTKPAVVPNTFNVAEVLAAARKALAVLDRPVSAPNYEDARREIKHVIDLLLAHKSAKPAGAAQARAA
jgi:hypothetical protein